MYNDDVRSFVCSFVAFCTKEGSIGKLENWKLESWKVRVGTIDNWTIGKMAKLKN